MCANDNQPETYQPLLNRLFDSEAGSDVIFLVGPEPETWRFPCHKRVLCEANPVFKAMLENFHENGNTEQTISIQDIDGRAFDLLLRFLYKEDVIIQTVATALSTLYAAQKYLCMELMRECILFLDDALTTGNALQIYEHLRVHSGQRVKGPSAPRYEIIHAETKPGEDFSFILRLLDSLLFNTLLFIDLHAEEILCQESIEDLTLDSLKEILERDTLNVREALVYNTIERWCNRECKRGHFELSQENRRTVLGEDILFSVRYLLMSPEDFISGPMSGNLLSKPEIMTLFAYLQNVPVTNTCSTLSDDVIHKMKVKRRQPKDLRIQLGKKRRTACKKGEKKSKKKKEKNSSSPSCTGSCVADYVLRALSCLFD
ncbi:BTB/POZ domain-containing protein 2 isoform X1 [Halyomorpha halys]|uniref:BTB/POZ domain-containing protein 2 isoform X1 n=2 Tax=Halyomorpha halys TaxID=286706 RepID=UPI0006D4D42D|nr:BTB/POZ domain-containing protein 2-like [Halyomorpha halys]XP_014271265.1 BTB/POZ domain-containing protein 2-like [Halyomorpha halys]